MANVDVMEKENGRSSPNADSVTTESSPRPKLSQEEQRRLRRQNRQRRVLASGRNRLDAITRLAGAAAGRDENADAEPENISATNSLQASPIEPDSTEKLSENDAVIGSGNDSIGISNDYLQGSVGSQSTRRRSARGTSFDRPLPAWCLQEEVPDPPVLSPMPQELAQQLAFLQNDLAGMATPAQVPIPETGPNVHLAVESLQARWRSYHLAISLLVGILLSLMVPRCRESTSAIYLVGQSGTNCPTPILAIFITLEIVLHTARIMLNKDLYDQVVNQSAITQIFVLTQQLRLPAAASPFIDFIKGIAASSTRWKFIASQSWRDFCVILVVMGFMMVFNATFRTR